MNKKRTATDSLLPLRSSKQPRTAFTRPDGSRASPSEAEGLRSRWKSALGNLWDVGRDTVTHLLPGKESPNNYRRATTPIRPQPHQTNSPRHYTHHRRNSSQTSSSSPQPPPVLLTSLNFTRSASELHEPIFQRPSNNPPLLASQRQSRRQSQTPRRRMPPPPTPPPKISTEIFPTFPHPPPSPAPSSSVFSTADSTRDGVRRSYKNREHILAQKHKRNVKEEQKKARDAMLKELYKYKQQAGYRSDLATFEGYMSYRELLERDQKGKIVRPSRSLASSSSLIDLRALSATPNDRERGRRHSTPEISTAFLQSALEKAKATLQGPKPPKPFSPSLDQLRIRQITKDDAIEQRLRPKRIPLPTSLPPKAEATVSALMKQKGTISSYARETVSSNDIWRLGPGQWLNDEIINFWGAMLLGRAEAEYTGGGATKENGVVNGVKKKKVLDAFYFTTFFWTKLEKDGYEKGRLAKWTKRVDIFSKDVILIPINHSNAHWTGAAINFRKKRIESYDSMHYERTNVLERLREYLDAEHRNKRKKPFDFTGWEDYTPMHITPMQENGFDCGVFTCQFLECLSRGEEEFPFTQQDIPYLRRRMIWEIGNARFWSGEE